MLLERCVRVSLTGLLVLMMVAVAVQRGTFVVDALLTLSPPSSNDARWTIASTDNPSGAAEELHTLRVAVSSRVVISYDAALSMAANGHVLAKVGSEDVDDGDFSLSSGLSVTSEASGEIQLSGGYGDDIQVVLTRPYQLQNLLTTGIGDVVVLDQVFANAKVNVGDAAINIDVSGSGNVFVHTSETLTAKNASWTIRGYGDLQVEAQAFNFDSLEVNAKGLSSNVNVFANSEQQQSPTSSSIGSASFVGIGLSEMCLDTPNIEIASIEVWLSGAGTLSFSQPGGTCATEELVVTGSGNVHLDALRCSNVKVQMSGSGDVTVQATDYLGGSISGSGSVKYVGAQPPRTMSDKNGRVVTGISLGQPSNGIAKPAHQTPTVSCRRSSVPTLKANHVGGNSIPVPLVPSDQMMDKPVSTTPASVDAAPSIDWTAISRFISTHAHSSWEFIKENRYVAGVVAAFAVVWISLLLVVQLQQRRRKSKRQRRRRRDGERRPLLQHDDKDEDAVYI
uniref:Putative auto-transporter adhesin head GIN domain-containing protein n=1 Tax=Globisporangium ultimum (strain ATCC 200006 / CBS 805.95 / DAOM BR144) TaxID=431595 RepID=K3X9I4_GLOUD